MLDHAALLIAFLISTVSAYYSISGLTAIFAGAVKPIIVMGCALEVGKVITTLWLRKNWNQTGSLIKAYLSASIIVLMLITSMGIFGFLSRAHLEQGTPSADIQSQIQLLDEKIQTERDNIAANRTVLTQMDNSVNEILGRSKDENGAARAVQVRRSQAAERTKLQKENDAAQQRIQKIQAERLPLVSQIRKIEVEVGPIKYIAALIYGDNPGADFLERAVRWVIIILVAVFDPLALVLMLAVNRKRELDQLAAVTTEGQPTLEPVIAIPVVTPDPPAPDPVTAPELPIDASDLPTELPETLPDITSDIPLVPTDPIEPLPVVEPTPVENTVVESLSPKKKKQQKKKLESNTSLDPNESSKSKRSSKNPSKSLEKSQDPNESLKSKRSSKNPSKSLEKSLDLTELLKSKKSSKSSLKQSEKSQDPNELSKLKDQLKSKNLLKKLSKDQSKK